MPRKDGRAFGESERRLYGLDAWRETAYYTPREQAALAWTEAVTLVHETHAPDEVYDHVCLQFTAAEVANLTFVIATINAWNRLAVSLRAGARKYAPPTTADAVGSPF